MGHAASSGILGPEAGPREHHDEHAGPDGDGDLDGEQEALRPDRRVRGGRVSRLGWAGMSSSGAGVCEVCFSGPTSIVRFDVSLFSRDCGMANAEAAQS